MLDTPPTVALQPVTDACVMQAAQRFALPPRLLYAILAVEGGTVGKVSKNTNGSFDMGPMQINSLWRPTFSGYVTEAELINDGCKNVLVGGWLLRRSINLAGDFWRGVGNYHSATPKHHRRYVQKVYEASLTVGPFNDGTRSAR